MPARSCQPRCNSAVAVNLSQHPSESDESFSPNQYKLPGIHHAQPGIEAGPGATLGEVPARGGGDDTRRIVTAGPRIRGSRICEGGLPPRNRQANDKNDYAAHHNSFSPCTHRLPSSLRKSPGQGAGLRAHIPDTGRIPVYALDNLRLQRPVRLVALDKQQHRKGINCSGQRQRAGKDAHRQNLAGCRLREYQVGEWGPHGFEIRGRAAESWEAAFADADRRNLEARR